MATLRLDTSKVRSDGRMYWAAATPAYLARNLFIYMEVNEQVVFVFCFVVLARGK